MDEKETLHHYLRVRRDNLLGKLAGLSEYDVRRPLTPTGTNLLGLVKHVASVELGYLGEVFRPLEYTRGFKPGGLIPMSGTAPSPGTGPVAGPRARPGGLPSGVLQVKGHRKL
jgi:Protein of unknown function (DUF664)